MPRRKPDNLVKERMWTALIKAAKSYHRHDADRGMVTKIAADAGVSKASVSEWKNKGNYPEEATLRRLASLYNVSAESLSFLSCLGGSAQTATLGLHAAPFLSCLGGSARLS
jgi:transcriptional regulator with XRE-family HTH domain